MNIITDKQLTELGFNFEPFNQDECDSKFKYRVAKIETRSSYIEIINEYRNDKLTKQYANYEIIEDGVKAIDIETIKNLKKIIL